MKILQIHPFIKSETLAPAAGGMARLALLLTRALKNDGHDVQVLPNPENIGRRYSWSILPNRPIIVQPTLRFPVLNDWFRLFLPLLRIRPPSSGFHGFFYDAMALTGLQHAICSFQPDIIHDHTAGLPFIRLAAALPIKRPLVLTHHHGELAIRRSDPYNRIIFNSTASLEQMVLDGNLPRERVRKVYPPIPSVFSEPFLETTRSRKGIYFIGAVSFRKGIDLLLEAYRKNPRLHREPLHICGAGGELPLVQRAILDERLPIIWEGMLSQRELAEKLRTAKIAVVPSRLESFCTALTEAIGCGVPVVGWEPTVTELSQEFSLPIGIPFDGRTQSGADLAVSMIDLLESDCCRRAYRKQLSDVSRCVLSESAFLNGNLSVYRELI